MLWNNYTIEILICTAVSWHWTVSVYTPCKEGKSTKKFAHCIIVLRYMQGWSAAMHGKGVQISLYCGLAANYTWLFIVYSNIDYWCMYVQLALYSMLHACCINGHAACDETDACNKAFITWMAGEVPPSLPSAPWSEGDTYNGLVL